ncbi:MAG: serine phosphatase [Bryobacterales bacterium]|nr:serine phosphatase [Bryobacterales bacterium]
MPEPPPAKAPGKFTRKRVLLALIALDVILFAWKGIGGLAVLLAFGLIFYGLVSGLKALFRKSTIIWRLRNRLMVTYVFIGGVPILLILVLSFLGAWIVVGQVATYLVTSELTRRAGMLENPARFLARARPSERAAVAAGLVPLLRDKVPGVEIVVTGAGGLNFPEGTKLEPPPKEWTDYTGVVRRNGRYYLMGFARNGETEALLLAPLGGPALSNLIPGIGEISIYNFPEGVAGTLEDPAPDKGIRVQSRTSKAVRFGDRDVDFTPSVAGAVPAQYGILDRPFWWVNEIEVAEWTQPNVRRQIGIEVTTRTSAVLATVFSGHFEFAEKTLYAFIGVVGLLAFVELISVVIGISMTRTITGAVHNLYQGTVRIGLGDFTARVPVKGTDQLADLGDSFNKMTQQLSGLVEVAKEKERLQSEVSIATEVQSRLFPLSAPLMQTIQLLGTCEPARSVSGDYYDYLRLPSGNLALAIGDVAGKGISAALLMASIQSIMRTQLVAGLIREGAVDGHFSTATIVEQLSRQLYANTSSEKYATFFFGVYDDTSRILRYTNAGHLSPLLISSGNISPLEVTGTVIGMFPSVSYEERTVGIAAGDLLIAYTDGITEPENSYGEEFGIERLADIVLKNQKCELPEMVARVRESVRLWSGAPELPDDMTVLIARGLA